MTLETPPSPAPALSLLSLQQQVSTLDLAADTVKTVKQVPAPVEKAVEHLLELLMAAVPDAAAQEEPVLAGAILGGLQPPLQSTPAKVQSAKEVTLDSSGGDDEMVITMGGEICTVCEERCMSVRSLQEHIVKKHCTISNKMLDLLKMQEQMLNKILTNQSIQENSINSIAATQTCVLSDIKELKGTVLSSEPRLAAPPVPAVSAPQVAAAARPAPPPASRLPAPQATAQPAALPAALPAPLDPPALQSRPYAEVTALGAVPRPNTADRQAASTVPVFRPAPRPRGKRKVLFLADSVNRCLVYPKLENPTGSLIRQVNCYSRQYD